MTTPFEAAAERVARGADHHVEAAGLVATMRLDEKLDCLDGDTPFWPGLFDMAAGGYYRHPWPAAVVERLGIPGIQFADGPRGAVICDGTVFPVSMARGATFDPILEERVGDVIGLELRAAGATFTGAVCMNLLRHPAWGRAQETYGEDPHHVGVMAAAFTRGLQRHVMACMKHFALNSMENARFTVDVEVDERALHEVYLPHFERVASEGVASTMSAYNSVNGSWCGEHSTLLTHILRDEWGWDGFVISDFIFGLRDPVTSVGAGLDIEMPFRQQRATRLGAAIESGDLVEADVDLCVRRVVATLLRHAGIGARRPDPGVIGAAAHRALAREVAAASTVLVRNQDDLLPVADPSSVVVLGRLADRANLGDGGSSDVKSTTAVTPLEGIVGAFGGDVVRHDPDLYTDGVRDAARDADLVIVVVGYTKHDEGEFIDNSGNAELIGAVFPPRDHPAVGVSALGGAVDTGDGEGRGAPNTETERDAPAAHEGVDLRAVDDPDAVGGMSAGGDRTSLRLRPADEKLIADAAALSDRVVVVVQCGSAVMMPWVESVPAVLVSWYGGVELGHALADVVTGRREPSGRLPFVIPTEEDHLPSFDKDATSITYDLFHGQWLLDRDGHPAHFPFGFGLGYTRLHLGDVSWSHGDAGVRVEVANTGERTGSTVVFVFAGHPGSDVPRPVARLIGFTRLSAEPGASVSGTIDLDWALLDIRRDGRWWTEPGTYHVWVGLSANDPGAHQLTTERR